MAITLYDLSSDSGFKKLDEYLLTRSYISGYVTVAFVLLCLFFFFSICCFLCVALLPDLFRFQASKDDVTVYAALSKAPSEEFVNVSRWYKHIDALLRIS